MTSTDTDYKKVLNANKGIKSLSNWVAGGFAVVIAIILLVKIDLITNDQYIKISSFFLVIPIFFVIRLIIKKGLVSIVYALGLIYKKSNIDLLSLKYKVSTFLFAAACLTIGIFNYMDRQEVNSIISGKWQKVVNLEENICFINPDTVKYLSNNDEVVFWMKVISGSDAYYPMVKIKCSTMSYKILTDSKEKVKFNLLKQSPMGYMWKDKYKDAWQDIRPNSINYYVYKRVCEEKQ